MSKRLRTAQKNALAGRSASRRLRRPANPNSRCFGLPFPRSPVPGDFAARQFRRSGASAFQTPCARRLRRPATRDFRSRKSQFPAFRRPAIAASGDAGLPFRKSQFPAFQASVPAKPCSRCCRRPAISAFKGFCLPDALRPAAYPPVDARTTKCTGSCTRRASGSRPSIICSSVSAAKRPSSSVDWCTEVSGTAPYRASEVSS